jgi:simple sugar transport system permease protein
VKALAARVDGVVIALAALAVTSTLILVYGQSPGHVYARMMERSWGDTYGFGQVLFRTAPLVFTGLAVAIPYRAGLFNIGGEGQLVAGSFACGVVGVHAPWPIALACAALAGGLLGAIPGVLRVTRGAHEVITTIMLNFITSAVVLWAGRRWFFVPENVHTAPIRGGLASLHLAGSAANASIFLAVALAIGAHFFVTRTRPGFELRAVGENPEAAAAAGVSLGAVRIWSMTLGGACAGLVGASTVLGYKHYFEMGQGAGYGFVGIAVALAARAHLWAIPIMAFTFATLAQGGLGANALVPREIVDVLQAVLILGIAVGAGRRA